MTQEQKEEWDQKAKAADNLDVLKNRTADDPDRKLFIKKTKEMVQEGIKALGKLTPLYHKCSMASY